LIGKCISTPEEEIERKIAEAETAEKDMMAEMIREFKQVVP